MDTVYVPNQSVNPVDLGYTHNTSDTFSKSPLASEFDAYGDVPFDSSYDFSTSTELGYRNQDSAIHFARLLRLQQEQSYSRFKDDDPADLDAFLEAPYSSEAFNTPSPNTDLIFSNTNSPGGFAWDQNQTSSPETNNDLLCQEAMASRTDDSHLRSLTPDVIHIPQSTDPPIVFVFPDKTKTRAETQIKMTVILDPLPAHYNWLRFPRNTLSKPKQLASDDEIQTNERRDGAVRLGLALVCATAVDKKEGMDRALRRARGEEKTPRRPRGVAINKIDKDDPAHPQEGGAILICDGCKERERKRYDRKKKRNEDEDEWTQYEDHRIIIVNEKEFKRWQDMKSDGHYTSAAKKVEFPMRIACYCRHQEGKSPAGYRVIFTFIDGNDIVLSQHASEIILITDDYKKEAPADVLQHPLTNSTTIPVVHQDELPSLYKMPLYQYNPTICSAYSQPTTPAMP